MPGPGIGSVMGEGLGWDGMECNERDRTGQEEENDMYSDQLRYVCIPEHIRMRVSDSKQ